jgi:hypothetical protein
MASSDEDAAVAPAAGGNPGLGLVGQSRGSCKRESPTKFCQCNRKRLIFPFTNTDFLFCHADSCCGKIWDQFGERCDIMTKTVKIYPFGHALFSGMIHYSTTYRVLYTR